VLVDLRRGGGLEDADWWLAIYVMLTRARNHWQVTLAWFCELLTLVQVVHWLVLVMFLQTCLTGGVLTCLGMFVCLA